MPFSSDRLWAKAKVYFERAISSRDEGEFALFQLWAALALELLAKSTLANRNPVLLVDPRDTESLYVACGQTKSTAVKTIPAHTVFERCRRLVSGFDDRDKNFCGEIFERRNGELHSALSPFEGVDIRSWQSRFWRIVKLLAEDQKKDLGALLGRKEAKEAREMVSGAARALEVAIRARIDRKRSSFISRNPSAPPRLLEQLRTHARITTQARLDDSSSSGTCPSCGCDGLLTGSAIEEHEAEARYEEPPDQHTPGGTFVVIETVCETEGFECFVCGLRLDSAEEIEIAGLPAEFVTTREKDYEYEEEYGND